MSPEHSRIRVKVCGLREPAEAAALDALGVDWIGFNFHPASARYVSPEAAGPMARALKRALPVGVFVDAPVDHVIDVATSTGMKLIQLHGSEDWDYVRRMPLPVNRTASRAGRLETLDDDPTAVPAVARHLAVYHRPVLPDSPAPNHLPRADGGGDPADRCEHAAPQRHQREQDEKAMLHPGSAGAGGDT